jgi:hypothetical protein
MNIWTKEGISNRRQEKILQWKMHDIYASTNTVRFILRRKIRYAGQVTRIGDYK